MGKRLYITSEVIYNSSCHSRRFSVRRRKSVLSKMMSETVMPIRYSPVSGGASELASSNGVFTSVLQSLNYIMGGCLPIYVHIVGGARRVASHNNASSWMALLGGDGEAVRALRRER